MRRNNKKMDLIYLFVILLCCGLNNFSFAQEAQVPTSPSTTDLIPPPGTESPVSAAQTPDNTETNLGIPPDVPDSSGLMEPGVSATLQDTTSETTIPEPPQAEVTQTTPSQPATNTSTAATTGQSQGSVSADSSSTSSPVSPPISGIFYNCNKHHGCSGCRTRELTPNGGSIKKLCCLASPGDPGCNGI